MKIIKIETLRVEALLNLLWVRVHTDAGIVGLGETFYGPEAVAAHIHETLARRLLGRDPLHIEAIHKHMVDLPMAQSSTGVEYRAASAIDFALWDIFGKLCGQPVHQMLGGICREKLRIYNTCAGYQYVQGGTQNPAGFKPPVIGPYEDLEAFTNRADELAESLLSEGITAMKIWPFDVPARETEGMWLSADHIRAAVSPFEKIRRAVGDRMDIMVEMHSRWNLPMATRIAQILEPFAPAWFEDPIRMNSPQALAEFARSTKVPVCASEVLGSRWPYKELLDRDATHIVMVDLCWTGGITEGRKIASMAETYQRPFAAHDCVGPVTFAASVHTSFSQPNTLIQEAVRAYYTGWYRDFVTAVPRIADGYVYPMEGVGLGLELLPSVFERGDLRVRVSEA